MVEVIARQGPAGALIGVRLEDDPHERLQVELVLHEIIGRGRQQGVVARRVRDPHVVDFLDQADAEKVGPDAVGDRSGEVGVLGRGQPLRQAHAAIGGIVEVERLAVERRRRLRLARPAAGPARPTRPRRASAGRRRRAPRRPSPWP